MKVIQDNPLQSIIMQSLWPRCQFCILTCRFTSCFLHQFDVSCKIQPCCVYCTKVNVSSYYNVPTWYIPPEACLGRSHRTWLGTGDDTA